jgi:hypothetical protein
MDRLDNTISDVAYILDSLCLLRNILETGSCNDCKRRNCNIVPKPGQMVRYNCAYYRSEKS